MTEPGARPQVYFVSLGCPKNLVDSQVMLGKLEQDRYDLTRDPSQAEVIIINTCSFIQAAKEESIETILELSEQKRSGRCQALVVSGCLPQRYSKELEKEMPEIDLMIGTGQYHRVTELLEKNRKAREAGGPLPVRAYIDQPAFIHTEKDTRVQTGPSYTAYLKLSEGCNRRCAFCIIPKLRGNVRSRTVESLVTEARELAARGVRELNLVAQDLTEYGMEWKYKERLETLLPRLCAIDGIEWIRLHYVYPDEFSDELIEIIAREKKIVKYLDMPIQHTNNDVLRSMNRRLTKEKLFRLVSRLRERIPSLVIRTSIIVGFPGETEEQYEELKQDLKQLDLDHVGVFRYSQEEGTKAAEMNNQVHPSTRRRRMRELIELLQKRSFDRTKRYVGTRVLALIEGPSEETDLLWQARMPTQAQEIDGHVLINDVSAESGFSSLTPGDLVEVEITEALPHDVIGRVTRVHSPARTTAQHEPAQPGLKVGLRALSQVDSGEESSNEASADGKRAPRAAR